ncbi:Glycosyltransferase [human gut metagenome]|uniref:Glycosyltransferase n=1 Tax=human gut metagenome TaxID=408170 RepID=W1XXW8_9ZZZZ
MYMRLSRSAKRQKKFLGITLIAVTSSILIIGMGLIANVTAYDLGYITFQDLINKTKSILNSMRTLEKFNGHYHQ